MLGSRYLFFTGSWLSKNGLPAPDPYIFFLPALGSQEPFLGSFTGSCSRLLGADFGGLYRLRHWLWLPLNRFTCAGSGSGSPFKGLTPRLPAPQHWCKRYDCFFKCYNKGNPFKKAKYLSLKCLFDVLNKFIPNTTFKICRSSINSFNYNAKYEPNILHICPIA